MRKWEVTLTSIVGAIEVIVSGVAANTGPDACRTALLWMGQPGTWKPSRFAEIIRV